MEGDGDGDGGKEEALVEGHWPGNQDVWVEVLPALLIIVIINHNRLNFMEHCAGAFT